MKKLFSIVMLLVILFNAGGYSLFFQYMIYCTDTRAMERINHNDYNNAELVEVKIPVNLPTQPDQSEYLMVSGQVQFKNNSYNYAEMKITRDTLYLLVVPNSERTRLVNANIIYAKQVNDIPSGKKPEPSFVKKSSVQSIVSDIAKAIRTVPDKVGARYPDAPSSKTIKPFLDVQGQPPEVLSAYLS